MPLVLSHMASKQWSQELRLGLPASQGLGSQPRHCGQGGLWEVGGQSLERRRLATDREATSVEAAVVNISDSEAVR